MADPDDKPRLLGINHVALEVGDIDAALDFYGGLFDFELRSRGESMAFLDMGDQFLALAERHNPHPDDHRHFGLVVDDREPLRQALEQTDADILPGRGLDFRDPWGNRIQVVNYRDIQFTKADPIVRGMGLADLEKTREAREQLRRKGLGDDAEQ